MIAFDEPPTRCPEGTRLARKWMDELEQMPDKDALFMAFFGNRPYDAHLATCEQCQADEKWRDE